MDILLSHTHTKGDKRVKGVSKSTTRGRDSHRQAVGLSVCRVSASPHNPELGLGIRTWTGRCEQCTRCQGILVQ